MHREQQRGKAGRGGGARALPRALAACSCALGAALALGGCNHGTKLTHNGDPLVGEMHPNPKPYGVTPQPASQRSRAVAPLPEPLDAGSLAELNRGQPLPEPDPLIGEGRPLALRGPTTPGGWEATPPAALTSRQGGQPPAPTLRAPQPVEAVSRVPGQPSQGAPGQVQTAGWPGASSWDYRQLQAQLKARGVTWQKQESYKDGFKFTCSAPNPRNPEYSRIYEAEARDYEAAILAVLREIDKDQQGR